MSGRLFILSAPSGTGKTTVARRVIRRVPNLTCSISCTTRSMRPGERNGRDYWFLTREEFLRRRERGEFLEWAEVHGNLYGTPRRGLLEAESRGKDLVMVIDVQGAQKIWGGGTPAVGIFLLPPSEEVLARRLRGRATEGKVALRRRLAAARRELKARRRYHYWVVNDSLERAVRTVAAIIVAERHRRPPA